MVGYSLSRRRRFIATASLAFILVRLLVTVPCSGSDAVAPAATIKIFRASSGALITERSMGLIEYRGKEYPIRFHGLSPIEFRHSVAFEVYNLSSLNDLNGVFLPADSSKPAGGCFILRNDRAVEIRFAAEHGCEEVHFDGLGITTSIASESIEAGTSRIHGRVLGYLPQSAGFGSRYVGPFLVTPTLNVQAVGFTETNNGWGGRLGPSGSASRYFYEQSNEEGLNASLNLGQYGILVGRVSGIFSMTGGGLEADGNNATDLHPWDYGLESGYVEWASGLLFSELGYDAITVSAGPQNFTIADGFLFTRGATNGGTRGGAWLNARTAFRQTGIVTLQTHGVLLQGFYLQPNDNPSTDTKLAGVNFETPITEYLETGFTYANIFRSDIRQEQGMNLFYWRGKATPPVPSLMDLHLSSAFAIETNGQRVAGATGWYVSPYYEFSRFSWRPTLFYRYASFSGGGSNGNQNFDPLFYGAVDWGSWYQGEIMGNWVAINSNLISHQVRLELAPTTTTTVNLIYYKFMLYSRAQELVATPAMPVTSKNLADEVNLTFEYAPTPWWVIAASISASVPNQAATQITGGHQTWVQSMFTTGVTF